MTRDLDDSSSFTTVRSDYFISKLWYLRLCLCNNVLDDLLGPTLRRILNRETGLFATSKKIPGSATLVVVIIVLVVFVVLVIVRMRVTAAAAAAQRP